MSNRVLLLGCGQVGSRHLQAVASLPQVQEVEVVDPRPEALQMGRERLAEVAPRPSSMRFRWLSSLEEVSKGGDLCIVATHAQGRCERVKEVARELGYRLFLLEKLVAQSVPEMEDLMEFSKTRGLGVWVNCKSRAYSVHQRLKNLLDPADPLLFEVVGGNHGLANNGVHMADLFAFYDGSGRIEGAGSHIDPILHSSKRSSHLFDLSGTLHGITARGSRFILTYTNDHYGPELITVTTRRRRFVIDHMSRWAMESDESAGGQWRPVPFEGGLRVSELTREFVADLLSRRRCALPTLEGSLVAHRFILSELQPHFRRLLRREVELCPVT